MKPLRNAIGTLIAGQITYNSGTVKAYDEKVFTGEMPTLYILFSTQQETPGPEQNDCSFMIRSSIDIEIIAKSGSEVSKDVIDDVSNTLMELINPTQGEAGFTMSGFQIIDCGKESAITQNLVISPTESILRKVIRFYCNIVQQN